MKPIRMNDGCVEVADMLEKIEAGIEICEATHTGLLHLSLDDAYKLYHILRCCPNDMKVFGTDGELYDESLTRNTKMQAQTLLTRIKNRIERHGYLNITWLVVRMSKMPKPLNNRYACTHGWIKEDIPKFEVRKHNDGRYGVYVGKPRVITHFNYLLQREKHIWEA